MRKIQEDYILSYIEDHLDSQLSVEDVAQVFGYSSDHFRHIFRTYYDISPGEYMRRRRLVKAAKQIQNGKQVTSAAMENGFETAAGFAKAFKKEFGFPASEVKDQKDIFLDEFPDPVYDKNLIKISYLKIPELKMLGKPLLPRKERGYDLTEEVACWLDSDRPEMEWADVDQVSANQKDMIAMWYHDMDNVEITYLLGPVVKDFHQIPPDMIPVTIPGRKYVIFETKRKSDKKQMAETIRMMDKYIFWEWVPANAAKKDRMGFTFERYRDNKVAIYLPVL